MALTLHKLRSQPLAEAEFFHLFPFGFVKISNTRNVHHSTGVIKMKSFAEIAELLAQGSFKEAEEALAELKKNNYRPSVINYFLGHFYVDYRNPSASTEKARNAFALSVKSEEPVEDAFLQLAKLEPSPTQAVRIIKGGLRHFPNSTPMFNYLLSRTIPDDREAVFQEMLEKAIVNPAAIRTMIQTRMNKGDFKAALHLIEQLKPLTEEPQYFLGMLSAICLLETKKVREAIDLFSALIQEDLTKSLEYGPQFQNS